MVRVLYFYNAVFWADRSLLVWCWGWDGAGDLEGPDVDPIWERMSNQSTRPEAVIVKHDRSIIA